ncbi:MAG TPA: hypothetical protein PK777_11340, partial [Thermoguttaceae bacterium]|nr:hypothetical protein [Thermoguttaceae bacterium]
MAGDGERFGLPLARRRQKGVILPWVNSAGNYPPEKDDPDGDGRLPTPATASPMSGVGVDSGT